MYLLPVRNSHSIISKVIQNNTNMCIKESPQQIFKISNINLDVRFEKVYQKHNSQTKNIAARKQNKPKFLMVSFQNVILLMHRRTRKDYPESHYEF